MAAHEPQWDEVNGDCLVCGARYHCPKCNDGSGMMAHYISTGSKGFYSCVDLEEFGEWKARNKLERELKERC